MADWLDDAAWEPWAHRIRQGEFGGAVLEAPASTYSDPQLRSAERPAGVKGLLGEDKERVRIETVLGRRLATIASALHLAKRPWLVWCQDPDGGECPPPWSSTSWTSLRPGWTERRGSAPEGSWRAIGWLPDGTAGWEKVGHLHPSSPHVTAEMESRSHVFGAQAPWDAGPARPDLVLSSPHTMRLVGSPGEPGEAAPARSAADDPNRPDSRKEIRETENRASLGGMRNAWRAGRACPKL